jgi:cytosine/adenosine deaminase-related metal-dependent hydrolase
VKQKAQVKLLHLSNIPLKDFFDLISGAGQLTVKIRGPKGAFRVEMQREHLQDRTIICRYNPSEPGDYLISVKWSDEHVYGSPFHTHIFERQEELDRFIHEQNAYRLAQHQWRDEV